MRVSRAPEKRGGAGKMILVAVVVIAILVVGGLVVTFFPTSSDPAEAKEANPAIAPVGSDTQEADHPDQQVGPGGVPIPTVSFGDILSEGFLEVALPGDFNPEVWYTYQVNREDRQITMYLALYNNEQDAIVRTIQLDGYTEGEALGDAQITVHYPEGPKRLVRYNRPNGSIQMAQFYDQPYSHSIFTSQLRVALVNQDMVLTEAEGSATVQLQLDPTGLSDSEQIVFERKAPLLVDEVLEEVQLLVDRIEENRPR